MPKWQTSIPPYNEPLLLRVNGTIQNVTYVFDSDDDVAWFEPHFFNDPGSTEFSIGYGPGIEWMRVDSLKALPLPDAPEGE